MVGGGDGFVCCFVWDFCLFGFMLFCLVFCCLVWFFVWGFVVWLGVFVCLVDFFHFLHQDDFSMSLLLYKPILSNLGWNYIASTVICVKVMFRS